MRAVALLLGALLPVMAWSGPGSWSAEAPALRVAVAERYYHSAPLQPPGGVDARVTSVWWRSSSPPGGAVRLELCQAQRCVPLPSQRGRSEAFAGAAAGKAFYFRARLAPGVQKAVELQGLQLIVNYRAGFEASKSPLRGGFFSRSASASHRIMGHASQDNPPGA